MVSLRNLSYLCITNIKKRIMSEMTNKTIAVVANEKNEMHKSIFDDELFDDVTSYDSN